MNEEVSSASVFNVAKWAFHVQDRTNGERVQVLRHDPTVGELRVHPFEVNLNDEVEVSNFVDSRMQGTTSQEPSADMNAGVQLEGRGKRTITKPAYLRDYV